MIELSEKEILEKLVFVISEKVDLWRINEAVECLKHALDGARAQGYADAMRNSIKEDE